MSLSELWSLYGQNYIDALLATWGMTLESFAIAMVLAAGVRKNNIRSALHVANNLN